jgi:hypothetical protein
MDLFEGHVRKKRRSSGAFRSLTAVVIGGRLAALGCGDGEPEPTFTVRDSAGIAIVESSVPLWGAGGGWTVATEPTVTIGSPDGPDSESLYRVRGALRLHDGRIVVANSGSDELRFYDADATYHSATGRAGAGPGEFDTISRLWRIGDSLFVYDFQQGNRVSVFTSDGEYVRAFSLQPTADARIPLDADGIVSGHVLVQLSGRTGRPREGLAFDPELFLIYSATGKPVDTIAWLPGSETYFATLPGGSVTGMDRPYGLVSRRATGRDGMYFGSSETYEIGCYNTRGKLERLIRRAVPNPRVTDQERAAYESERRDEYASSTPPFRALLDMVELPETKPAYGRLLVDTDGNLWVAEYRRHREGMDRWDVFDPDGRWLSTVDTPTGLLIHEIGTDYVLGVRRDEFDVEYVELHGLAKNVGYQ